jgi:hypothetical protein
MNVMMNMLLRNLSLLLAKHCCCPVLPFCHLGFAGVLHLPLLLLANVLCPLQPFELFEPPISQLLLQEVGAGQEESLERLTKLWVS